MGVVEGLITAGTALYGAYSKKKAAKKAAKAMEGAVVDPNKVAADARTQAIENARASLELEQELTPESQALRRGATGALLPLIGANQDNSLISGIDRSIEAGGDADQSELFTESVAEARKQLSLGGELDSETRNEISRRAISRGGNTGAARYTTARDLGVGSLQLATDRLERGGRFGQMDQTRNQASFENLNRLRTLREQLATGRQNRAVSLAGFGQSLRPPDVGLAPGEFAGLSVQNSNIMAEAGAKKAELAAQNAANWGQAINTTVGAVSQLPIFNKT